jgi:hypothetical protein
MTALRSLVLCTLLLLVGRPAIATPVLDFTGGRVFGNGPVDETAGWRFTVTGPITVDALGVFDYQANGLTDSHLISLWTSGGTLLTSTTVTTADSTPVASTSSDGNWRFTPISPLILLPGDYVVGANYVALDPDFRAVVSRASTIPGVTFDAARESGGGPGFPTGEESLGGGWFGPNLDVVPEPITMFLGGTGLLALAYAGRKRLFRRST